MVGDEDATYPVTIDPLGTSPAWSVESNQVAAQLGVSVASAGDVNNDGYGDVILGTLYTTNDGYADVIVGAPCYDSTYTDEGAAFAYHGSSSGLSSPASWTKYGGQSLANFGYCVASAGDVNGDGYGDVIIGAPYFDGTYTDEGAAYVYLGSW